MELSGSWTQIGVCDEDTSGTLLDVLLRWKNMESRGDEAIVGVTLSAPVRIEGWDTEHTHLWPEDLAELANYLDRQSQSAN